MKNIIGSGIGNQKKWLTVNNFLKDEDWNLNYSEQSQKLLELNNIKLNYLYPNIDIDTDRLNRQHLDLMREGKKIAFGAADTFRSAAVNQLEVWAKKINVEIVKSDEGVEGPPRARVNA